MTLKIPKEPAALICGSVAYDTILVFPDRFTTHILPDRLHTLNVSFLVPQMRREFGGCAANIAYGLNLLGDRGIAMATAGHDFAPYRERMLSQGLSVEHIRSVDDTFTAQAFITTDLDNNQITAFHPGAMQFAHLNKVTDAAAPITLGIVAPDGRQAMIEHAAQFIPRHREPIENLGSSRFVPICHTLINPDPTSICAREARDLPAIPGERRQAAAPGIERCLPGTRPPRRLHPRIRSPSTRWRSHDEVCPRCKPPR